MDVWGSQNAGAKSNEEEEEIAWELEAKGKDALIVLLDVRTAMFAPYPHATTNSTAPTTWFHAVVELVIKLMKSKVIGSDNSLLSVVFFGTNKRAENSTLEGVFEFQDLGYPSAKRIKDLQALLEPGFDAQSELQSISNSEELAFSNALWHCGIAFSNARLKKSDSQRVWIFTNDDSPKAPDAEETGRIQKQIQNHVELKRTFNLFYMTPPGQDHFDLSKFYRCAFKDFSQEEGDDDSEDDALLQPAFPVTSLDELLEGSLRKCFRKRRLTTFPFYITKEVAIGVELYAMVVVQRKSYPIALEVSTNTPLRSETKWLCQDTGIYLTPDQIKRYIEYGGKRVYFSRDDILEIKYYDAPGLQLICFKPLSTLKWNDNVRAPYFIYPCDGYIEGSTTAFVALLNAMAKKEKYALARLIARKTSEPRLVALIPQEEVNDELGQVQASGFNVIFLPYLDDIRDIPIENNGNEMVATQEKIEGAKHLIAKLKLSELPTFENPELQKHYASIQALALAEEELEFDETKDSTLPDEEGFAKEDVKAAIEDFSTICGGDLIDMSNAKRKSSISAARSTTKKKVAKGSTSTAVASDSLDKDEWTQLIASDGIQKKTVAQLKEFLYAYGVPPVGKKADLIQQIRDLVLS